MHILLTDILTCPRCGPAFGLILLADAAEERRVLEGVLGCSNCREKYPVRAGVVDFGAPPQELEPSDDDAAAERLAAMLGVARGPAFLLLAGPAAAHASALARILDDVEVLTIGVAARSDDPPGVNRIYARAPLPLASGKVAGAAVTGAASESLLEEGARTVAPLGRLIIDPVPQDAEARLLPQGLAIVVQERDTAVAVRR
jgi:uncharacterized protein YbaR (Trm112 family)